MTKTRKRTPKPIIHGKVLSENNQGWKSLHIWGDPYQRGFAHGVLLHKELKKVQKTLIFLVKEQLHIRFSEYLKTVKTVMTPIVKTHPEIYQEIAGISMGAKYAGTNISIDILIGWNSLLSLYDVFVDNNAALSKKHNRCSAFIATGDATKNGDIIMAHNTHSDLVTGKFLNIVLKITPPIGSGGNEFVMQTSPGMICSTSDWYISKSGIVCCETTIADINYKPQFGSPYFCRIRETIQYANSLDDCIKTMKHNNAGDYACSWLFSDIRTGEIMLFELGLDVVNIQKTKNGVFYGMNSAISIELRTRETTDTDFHDITSRCGNRNYRMNYLLNSQYYGQIDASIAKKIMGDHYDSILGKNVMNYNSICTHSEMDANTNFKPHGSTDAKVLNTRTAKSLNFWGIFGCGCGKRDFKARDYIRQHPQHKHWDEVLEDIPIQRWTML